MQKNPLFGMLGALLITATLGFVAGRMTHTADSTSAKTADTDSNKNGQYTRLAQRGSQYSASEKRQKSSRRHNNVKATMRHLVAQLERSPMVNMDFDAIFSVWEIARDFSEDEVREALASIEGVENMQLRMTLQMMLMNRWGKINGNAAMEHAMAAENNQIKMMQVMGTLMSWTKEDPEAAFSWFEKNKDSVGRGMYASAYEGMIYQAMARHDLKRALDQVAKIDSASKKRTALTSIAQGIVEQPEKLQSFLQFLDDQNEPEVKKEVMSSAIMNMAMNSPEAAKKYINTITDAKDKAAMVENVVRGLSYSDPETALKWGLEQAPDEASQAKVVSNTMSRWVAQDPKKAAAWYDQQPEHLKSDTTVMQSAGQLSASGQYKEALLWTQRGKDPETMAAMKESTYLKWAEASPAKARAWAEGEGKEIMRGIDLDAKPVEPELSIDSDG